MNGEEEQRSMTQIRCYFALTKNLLNNLDMEQQKNYWKDFLFTEALPNGEVAEQPEPTFIQIMPLTQKRQVND